MQTDFIHFTVKNRNFTIYLPKDADLHDLPAVYICGGHDTEVLILDIIKKMKPLFKKGFPKFAMISPLECEWDSDYSPWEAEIFGGRHFSGNADAFYALLKDEVIPYAESNFPLSSVKRCIAGYSLGALAAIYFFSKGNLFQNVACISGSLWYPGWIDYISHINRNTCSEKAYFSLGKAEVKTRNALMKENGKYYEITSDVFKKLLGEDNVKFEWNNGGHGFEETERFIRALQFILG